MKDKNENRKGYKNTKLGWIPEVWDIQPAAKLCEYAVDCVNRTAPVVKEKTQYKMIRTSSVRHGHINMNEIKYVVLSVYKKWTRRLEPQEGDVILTREAPVGEVGLVEGSERIFLGQRLFHYRANEECLRKRYLLYSLLCPLLQKHLKAISFGAGVEHIRVEDALMLPIPIPPLPEQKAIASVLECWDKSIQKYEEKIEKKKNIKKGLMQKLLSGKQRLPGYDGEWGETRLGMMGKIISGGTPSTSNSDYWAGSIPWCTPSEVVALNGKYISATKRYISRKGLKESSANLLSPNSLIVCTRATIGNCAINTVSMTTNQGFKSIDAYVNTDIDFLFYSIVNKKRALLRLGSGSTFLEVSTTDFRKIKVLVPPLPEQKAIASVLSSADSEIKALEKKLALLRDQKKYLLNNLVTGTIRLPEFCKEVG